MSHNAEQKNEQTEEQSEAQKPEPQEAQAINLEQILQPHPPEHITQIVLDLCHRATGDLNARPVFVSCDPVYGVPYNECFVLVEQHVGAHGGCPVFGWAIWERTDVLIEAEFHAVWCAPDGTLIDISPRPVVLDRILFVPDKRLVYSGFQVDNVRMALAKDNDIKRLIFLAGEHFRLMNTGKLKEQTGLIEAPRRIAMQIKKTRKELFRLECRIQKKVRAKYS